MFSPFLRWLVGALSVFALAGLALFSAQTKMHDYSTLAGLKVGMSTHQLGFLGQPSSAEERMRIYTLPDQSNLIVSLEDGRVEGAWLELKTPLKIQDPSLRHLTFVRMGMDESEAPTWFYAASPGEGRVFKVSDQGFIKSITWVKPFTQEGPTRRLQALLRDFTVQRPYQL